MQNDFTILTIDSLKTRSESPFGNPTVLFFHYFSSGEPCSPLLTDNNFYIKNGREDSVLHLQTIFSTVILHFQFLIFHLITSFFTCVFAHILVQEEKSDRNYKKDCRTDCKCDKHAVHTLNKEVVESS